MSFEDWKEKVANCCVMLHIQPSEFWQMDLNDLNFWHAIAEGKAEGIRKATSGR